MFLKIFRSIFNWVFPKLCIGCELEDEEFCAKCWEQVSLNYKQVCPYCRHNSEIGLSCEECRQKRGTPLDGLLVIWQYRKKNVLAKAIQYFKYQERLEIGRLIAEQMSKESAKWLSQWEQKGIKVDLLTWVPMTEKKFKKRGFNQGQILAESIRQGQKIMSAPLLVKKRETDSQMTLTRQRRLLNLIDAFELNKLCSSDPVGKSIVIVDDIATTLATMEECAKTLKKAGAKEVFGLVAARQST